MSRITNAKEARAAIGKTVYWDDAGSRYIFLRSGKVTGYQGREIIIDGDYKWMHSLANLRTDKGKEWEKT